MSKKSFNAKYLSKYYPDNTLENILMGKPIFNSKNLQKTSSGFNQNIKSSNYNIKYKVSDNYIEFIDRVSNVIIKIRTQG
jgi:hypothetical protein